MSIDTFSCPVCKKPLASWVVRTEFACHHCSWALTANIGPAFERGLAAGVVTELVLLLLLWVVFGQFLTALATWLLVGFMLGVLVGGAVYWRSLAITPVRPQRALTGHSTGTPLAPREFQR